MAWRITRDLIHEPGDELPSRVGYIEMHTRISPLAVWMGEESQPLPGWPLPEIPFRLYDDDECLYYQGKLHDDKACDNQDAALSWGATDAGCTTIRVKRNGEWRVEIS